MSRLVIADFLISDFLSLSPIKQKVIIPTVLDRSMLVGGWANTYLAALKSISMTKSIEALFTFDRARARTMQDLTFMLHSGSLP